MFKFKKFAGALAMTVALAQVFTAVPVRAEETGTAETCIHEECSNYSESADSLCGNCYYDYTHKYESNGDGKSHVYTFICGGCQNTYVDNNSMCYFQDGTCNMCGQEETYTECSHENCNGELKETGYPICDECEQNLYAGGLKYVEINDEIHQGTSTCKCGDETGSKFEEKHFLYDSDGRCVCGYQVASEPSGDNNSSDDNGNSNDSELTKCPYCGENGQYYEWYTPYADYHVLLQYYGCCNKYAEDESTKAEHVFRDGGCIECGYKEGGAICEHTGCGRAADGTESSVCSVCKSSTSYIISFNADTHTYGYKCDGCGIIREDMGTVTDTHEFAVLNGYTYCMWCEYSEDCTVSGNDAKPSKPSEESKPSTPAVSEAQIAEMRAQQQAAAFEAAQKKAVTTADGRVLKTEITGVYEVADLSGTAVTTPKADVQKAVGLTDEQIAAGTNASIFMGNLYDKAVKEALTNAAAANGKSVLSMFISDMYTITKSGQMTKINSASQPVTMVFGLPKHAVNENASYSIISVTPDGQVVEMKDTDSDASTITIDTTVFGKYAIVY